MAEREMTIGIVYFSLVLCAYIWMFHKPYIKAFISGMMGKPVEPRRGVWFGGNEPQTIQMAMLNNPQALGAATPKEVFLAMKAGAITKEHEAWADFKLAELERIQPKQKEDNSFCWEKQGDGTHKIKIKRKYKKRKK